MLTVLVLGIRKQLRFTKVLKTTRVLFLTYLLYEACYLQLVLTTAWFAICSLWCV